MSSFSFPVAVSVYMPSLDLKVNEWAVNSDLLPSGISLSDFNKQRINWFAGYMFPEMEIDILERVMKFFMCLFRIDDLLDIEPFETSFEFLGELLKAGWKTDIPKESPYFAVAKQLKVLLPILGDIGTSSWKACFLKSWDDYLKAQRWELMNKQNNQVPNLAQYKHMRLDSSGVLLAVYLLKNTCVFEDCKTLLLENKLARIICLFNDLISLDKEKNSFDNHNELSILKFYTGCDESKIQEYARKQLDSLIKEFSALLDEKDRLVHYSVEWKRQMGLLLGGCIYWSEEDTLRYSIAVNGVVKK